ncbi:NAD/NADP octopine/nopaline dehydrogenase family protein [Microlunatus speluncae]|uniref:NAD/NADP octopine/nopaline dehydrogenase family protein n=1 Tax=Microlunatus speluncae TaxID=2594267 RepID=UPI0012666805|nr:NAD/NADP octopine/nopaline dehydrogenase family protein [Microlunatus speluncae]
MTLAVIGDSQAVAVAGLASRCSGQAVLLSRGPGRTRGAVRLEGMYAGPIEVHVIDRPTADVYVAVTTSDRLEPMLADHRELLAGRVLLVAPGGFGAAVRVRQLFDRWGVEPPVVAEATGFPAIGEGEGTIRLRGIKRALPIAGIDHAATDEVLTAVRGHLPDLVPSELATTSLSNTNHLLHPVIMMLNADRIARGEEFPLFRDGLSAELDQQLAAVDAERLELVERLGGEPVSIMNWMLRFYEDQGLTGSTISECLDSFPGFAAVPAPTSLRHRYLLDDIPHGLAGYVGVADRLGVDVPQLRSVISTAEQRLGQPLRAESSVVQAFLDAVSARPASAGCAGALH